MVFRGAAAVTLSAVLAAAGCQTARQEIAAGPTQTDPLDPGGRYLTYEPGIAAHGPLLEIVGAGRDHDLGRAIYYRDWLTATSPPLAGPDYDQSTCAACHIETAAAGEMPWRSTPPLVVKPVTAELRKRYGQQINLHRHGSDAAEAAVRISYLYQPFTYPDGETRMLRMPVARASGENGETAPVALRAPPLLFGWGLLERVEPDLIAHFDDPDDDNADGISGRLVLVASGRPQEAGGVAVLGWKNSHGSLRSQIAAALVNDMGVTSRLNCGGDGGGSGYSHCDAEIESWELDALTDYVRFLGVPNRRRIADRRGQDLFGLAGCSDCHVPVLTTTVGGATELSGQVVWPYSNLMLHDMGAGLADPGDAEDAREWRTAPLWGLGIAERHLPQRGFLHDGRARTIEEAILWHGGEAEPAKQHFTALDKPDREALLEFVRSL